MPELRQNFFTKEWVVIATERAKRPEQLIVDRPPRKLKSFVQNCPFCPGNENLTPARDLRVPNGDGAWKIRVVPNKFAALAREVPPARTVHRSRRTIQRFGVHDVIVETTDHSQAMALMSDTHVTDIHSQLIAAPVTSYHVRQRFSERYGTTTISACTCSAR